MWKCTVLFSVCRSYLPNRQTPPGRIVQSPHVVQLCYPEGTSLLCWKRSHVSTYSMFALSRWCFTFEINVLVNKNRTISLCLCVCFPRKVCFVNRKSWDYWVFGFIWYAYCDTSYYFPFFWNAPLCQQGGPRLWCWISIPTWERASARPCAGCIIRGRPLFR